MQNVDHLISDIEKADIGEHNNSIGNFIRRSTRACLKPVE